MPQKREKGKIAHGEWQKIVARYDSGETITQIGRDYGCTAPAIRYIVRKSGKLRDAAPPAGSAPVPQLPPPKPLTSEPPPLAAGRVPEERGGRLHAAEWAPSLPRATNPSLFGMEMRNRITGDIAAFLVAFDQATANNPESLDELQGATDRLMRASARVRIELERLLAPGIGLDGGDLATNYAAPRVARA